MDSVNIDILDGSMARQRASTVAVVVLTPRGDSTSTALPLAANLSLETQFEDAKAVGAHSFDLDGDDDRLELELSELNYCPDVMSAESPDIGRDSDCQHNVPHDDVPAVGCSRGNSVATDYDDCGHSDDDRSRVESDLSFFREALPSRSRR